MRASAFTFALLATGLMTTGCGSGGENSGTATVRPLPQQSEASAPADASDDRSANGGQPSSTGPAVADQDTPAADQRNFGPPSYPLLIRDIGLGPVRPPCPPADKTYVDLEKKPNRITRECTLGNEKDSIDVTYSSDDSRIVSVQRRQYLGPSDPSPEQVIAAAVEFYGAPRERDEENWIATYGDAHEVHSSEYRNYVGFADPPGIGLSIKGYFCRNSKDAVLSCNHLDIGDQVDCIKRARKGVEECKVGGTHVIVYELVDYAALLKSWDDARAKQARASAASLAEQKF